MRPLAYGYVRVRDDKDDQLLHRVELKLRQFASGAGFCLATIFCEDLPGQHRAFDELASELRRADAHHVIVPSMAHLSDNPLLQNHRLAHLALEADAEVLAVGDA
jgi:hypothetical protein